MKFLYDCTDSNNKKNKCIFEDRVGGGHSDSSDDMTSFEIQKTEGFFSIRTSFIVICIKCLSVLRREFRIDSDISTFSYANIISTHSVNVFNVNSGGTQKHVYPKPEHEKFIESLYNAYNNNNFDNQEMEELSSFVEKKRLYKNVSESKTDAELTEWSKARKAREISLQNKIKNLLKKKNIKMPASDIDAHLKHQDVEEIKIYCEELYHKGKISRTGNYRYFILSEEKKAKKTKPEKAETVDVKSELKKFKSMLDEGLITQEQYDAKSNKLLGL